MEADCLFMSTDYLAATTGNDVVDVTTAKSDVAQQVVVELKKVRIDLSPSGTAEQRREKFRHFGHLV